MDIGINNAYVQGAGGLLNADIGATAAIVYSKLSLTGGIVNADINASAAIVASKLSGYPSDATKVLAGDGTWIASTSVGAPTGAIIQFGAAAAPTGWLLCDGSSVLRTTYSTLYGVIGTTYGSADGTHFTLPDLRGRVAVGLGTNALVNALANSDGVVVGNRRPKHRHSTHTHTYDDTYNSASGGLYIGTSPIPSGSAQVGSPSRATSATDGGSGTSTDSLDAPAYLVVNYIIKT